MTRCMVRRDFFDANSYQIAQIAPPAHPDEAGKKPLIEFCLPFAEMKHIVEGMADEETKLELEYPVGDNFLQIKIPEDSRGQSDRVT